MVELYSSTSLDGTSVVCKRHLVCLLPLNLFLEKVEKIRAGHFVEMRDLLTENISLLQQLETLGNNPTIPSLPGMLKPQLREVITLPSWLYCYLAYVAVRSPDPTTRNMLAYARIIIREAQRHGGNGWLDYDRVFHQQAALDQSIQWNTLHPGIQAATLVGRASGQGLFCTLCRGADHSSERCALSYLQAPSQPLCDTPLPARLRLQPRRRPESLLRICISWNKGRCAYLGTCSFRHVCATCQQRHMVRDCSDTPDDSEYKRDGDRQAGPSPGLDRTIACD